MENITSWYDYPNVTNTRDIFEFFNFINSGVDGLFFPVILSAIWVISFITVFSSGGYTRPSAARAWVFSSFLLSVLSIPMTIMNFLATKYMYLTFIMLGLGLSWLKLEQPTVE